MKKFLLFLIACSYSTSCFALMISEAGNHPLSKENYTDWPNLVDAINDESRVLMTWVNGNESLSYHGETAAANRVLKEFSETKAPELQLILLPGPGRTQTIEKIPVTIDYEIEISGGISRAMIKRSDLSFVYELRPTMKIYLTENIDLKKLVIPDNLTVSSLHDLEERYLKAQTNKDPNVRETATRFAESLTKNFARTGEDYKKLQQQLEQIKQVIGAHRAKK